MSRAGKASLASNAQPLVTPVLLHVSQDVCGSFVRLVADQLANKGRFPHTRLAGPSREDPFLGVGQSDGEQRHVFHLYFMQRMGSRSGAPGVSMHPGICEPTVAIATQ